MSDARLVDEPVRDVLAEVEAMLDESDWPVLRSPRHFRDYLSELRGPHDRRANELASAVRDAFAVVPMPDNGDLRSWMWDIAEYLNPGCYEHFAGGGCVAMVGPWSEIFTPHFAMKFDREPRNPRPLESFKSERMTRSAIAAELPGLMKAIGRDASRRSTGWQPSLEADLYVSIALALLSTKGLDETVDPDGHVTVWRLVHLAVSEIHTSTPHELRLAFEGITPRAELWETLLALAYLAADRVPELITAIALAALAIADESVPNSRLRPRCNHPPPRPIECRPSLAAHAPPSIERWRLKRVPVLE